MVKLAPWPNELVRRYDLGPCLPQSATQDYQLPMLGQESCVNTIRNACSKASSKCDKKALKLKARSVEKEKAGLTSYPTPWAKECDIETR